MDFKIITSERGKNVAVVANLPVYRYFVSKRKDDKMKSQRTYEQNRLCEYGITKYAERSSLLEVL